MELFIYTMGNLNRARSLIEKGQGRSQKRGDPGKKVDSNERKNWGMDHHHPYHCFFLDSYLQLGLYGAGYFLAPMCFFSYLLPPFEMMPLALEESNVMPEKPSLESLGFLSYGKL